MASAAAYFSPAWAKRSVGIGAGLRLGLIVQRIAPVVEGPVKIRFDGERGGVLLARLGEEGVGIGARSSSWPDRTAPLPQLLRAP